VDYVTLRVDVSRGCLANEYTPPQVVDTVQYAAGSEPEMQVCDEPDSYQQLVIPSVIGLYKDAAISTLRGSGFNVAVEYTDGSNQPEGTVVDQEPVGGGRLVQTGTVTITVALGEPEPETETVQVSNVIGMQEGAASATLRQDGFEVAVVRERCDPGCDRRPGVVWAQSPRGEAPAGSTITIYANP
jgi:serine/threonine-protein kinase